MDTKQLTREEKTELLDWVSACQSAYHIESTPGHRFGGIAGKLEENREALVEYVDEILKKRATLATPVAAQAPIADKQRRVLEAAAMHLTAWLDQDECDCDAYGHSCGRPNVERTRDELIELLAAPVAPAAVAPSEAKRFDAVELILRDVCENEPANPEQNDTVCIDVSDLKIILDRHVGGSQATAALLEWAIGRWNAEVAQRPLVNVHRRSLDDTWRQVIRRCGADDVALLGPKHGDLVAAAPTPTVAADAAAPSDVVTNTGNVNTYGEHGHAVNMSQPDERAAFEAWASGEGYSLAEAYDMERGPIAGVYHDLETAAAWTAWQARASASQEDASELAKKDRTIAFLRDQNRRIIEAADRIRSESPTRAWATLMDDLYVLSANEDAMEEAIQQFEGSASGEALKCVFHAQKQLRNAFVASKGSWSKAPPAEQGLYWHWTGDLDACPIPLNILYSGTTGRCFVAIGQYGIAQAVDCDKYGGYWQAAIEPAMDEEIGFHGSDA